MRPSEELLDRSDPLGRVFSWAGRDTEKACSVIALLQENADTAYEKLAKATPLH
jgi:hypothetical protein